jgi:hypothetical protein
MNDKANRLRFIVYRSAFIVSTQLIAGVMQQADLARKANLPRDVALLFGVQAGVTARKNFAALSDEATQLRSTFIVEAGDKFRVERLALDARGAQWTARTGR